MSWPNEIAERPFLRNSTQYRGWPEYVSRVEQSKDLILLGNSQGVGTELPNVSDTYAAQVYDALKDRDPSLALHNWSVTGLMAHQLELLALKALSHDPALMILSVSLHNFNPTAKVSLARDETDIPLLVADPWLFGKELLNSKIIRNTAFDEIVRAVFKSISATGRSRTAGFDRLAAKIPADMERFVFGHWRPQPVLIPIHQRQEVTEPAPIRLLQINSPESHWDNQFRRKQLPVATEFYQRLKTQAEERGTKLLWIWMPFARRQDTSAILESMKKIHQEFCAKLILDGTQCVDFSDALDSQKFISPDLASHLTRPGHAEMAELMTPAIFDALY